MWVQESDILKFEMENCNNRQSLSHLPGPARLYTITRHCLESLWLKENHLICAPLVACLHEASCCLVILASSNYSMMSYYQSICYGYWQVLPLSLD
jgi:hypothetical protein